MPHTVLWRIPPAALIPAGLLLLWLAGHVRLPGRARRAAAGDASDQDAEAWLRRLEGLLRGRHKVSRADARRLAAEAREHLAAGGARPEEEFGDVEEYALRLVEEGAARRRTRESLNWTRTAALFVLLVISLVDRDWNDFGWWQWCTLAAALITGTWLARHYRDRWPSRKAVAARDENGGT
ncbi:hypothetical protein AN219_28695 [Streptomyces nanshensis]|nr:hypothetical protein AN219_28695 [Streptomyces nanshensis]